MHVNTTYSDMLLADCLTMFTFFFFQTLRERAGNRKAKEGGTGSGRLSKTEQAIEDKLTDDLKNARDGYLPDEKRPVSANNTIRPATLVQVHANAQHHADTVPVPKGPGKNVDINDNDNENDDNDHPGDEIDLQFAKDNYYSCSPAQNFFNSSVKDAFFTQGKTGQVVYHPKGVLIGRCQPGDISVTQAHVHAPHKSLCLALPPCPVCGWDSVDTNMVTTNGTADARRVYGLEEDWWVIGQRMLCKICHRVHKVKSIFIYIVKGVCGCLCAPGTYTFLCRFKLIGTSLVCMI